MKTKQVIMAIVICILCALSITFAVLGQSEMQVITNPVVQINDNINAASNTVNQVENNFDENLDTEASSSIEIQETNNTNSEISSSTQNIDNANKIENE